MIEIQHPDDLPERRVWYSWGDHLNDQVAFRQCGHFCEAAAGENPHDLGFCCVCWAKQQRRGPYRRCEVCYLP